jgi:FAD:protein FMN transferase
MKHSSKQRFTAMGSACSVEVLGDHASTLATYATARVHGLEQLWSRFLSDSDVSRINQSPGMNIKVSSLTIELLQLSLDAWESTTGSFCPFGERLMVFHGYNDSFERLEPTYHASMPVPSACVDGRAPMVVDEGANTVRIDEGFGIDLGGIAKGFTADLVADELIVRGAKAAMVDIGGDLACRNAPDQNEIWRVEVEDPNTSDHVLAWMDVRHGGVATSSTQRRTWIRGDKTSAHHVMDPRRQESAMSGVIACTVAADRCADAEVLTKLVLCRGLDTCTEVVTSFVPDVLAITTNGTPFVHGGWELT